MMTSFNPCAEPNNVTTLPAAIDGIMMDTAQMALNITINIFLL